jgi:hypothetical protein
MAHPSQKGPTARQKKGSFVAKVRDCGPDLVRYRLATLAPRRPTPERDVAAHVPSAISNSTTSLAAGRLKIDLEDRTMFAHSAGLRMRLPQVKLKSNAHWQKLAVEIQLRAIPSHRNRPACPVLKLNGSFG